MPSQEQPEIIEAQQFIVRDEAGKIRATLGVLNSLSEPTLSLHDREGIPRLYVQLVQDYPRLSCLRRDGNLLLAFGTDEHGSPLLGLSRNDGTPALRVTAAEGEDVEVWLCRADGEPVSVNIDDLAERGHEEEGRHTP